MEYNIGEVWEYKRRNKDEDSFIVITGIDQVGAVLHVAVLDIFIEKFDSFFTINHLPMSKNILESDLIKVVGKLDLVETIDYINSIEVWREAKGGVWKIPLVDVINNTISMMEG